jgi:predicted nuclease of predicted toxin-antitoxin system
MLPGKSIIRSSRPSSLLFLVDAQLPPALAEAMRRAGYDAAHVAEFGMANAIDAAIWNEAIARSAVLVTKDRDFSLLRAAKRQGPMVLWVRVGNIDNRALIHQFLIAMPQIVEAVDRGEAVIEFVGS